MINNLISSSLFRQYAVVISVNLCLICTGMGLSWPSPVLVKLSAVNGTDNVLSRPITENEGSWIVSIGFLIATVSNLFCASLVGWIGRKYSVLLACVPKLISVVLFIFASDLWMILLGRAINATGDSVFFTVVPMYASEVASKEIRGSLGTLLQVACSIGAVIMLSVGPILSYMTLNYVFLSMIILTMIPILLVPDSPYFLYTTGHSDSSLKVLTFLRGSEILAKEELLEYSMTKPEEKINKRALLHDKVFLKGLGMVFILSVGLQAVGYNAVSFYLQTILVSTKTSIKPETASAVLGFIQLLASFCTAALTDRCGRKPIFSVTLMLMAVGMAGLGTFFYIQNQGGEISGVLNFLPLASLILVVFCYSAGCGSLYWIAVAELFSDANRGIGCSFGTSLSTLLLFATTNLFPTITNAIGPPATYWTFSVCCVLFAMFTAFVLPETKGKTIAEIQTALGAKKIVIDK